MLVDAIKCDKRFIKDKSFPPVLHFYHNQKHPLLRISGGIFKDDDMVIKLIRHEKDFTSYYNKLLQGDDLSLEALGLLVKMVSRPPNWDFKKETFHTDKNGKFQINRIFKELQQFGHARIVNIYDGNRISDRQWEIYENPENNAEFVATKGSHLKTGLSTLRKPLIKTKQPLQRKNIYNTNNIKETKNKTLGCKATDDDLNLEHFETFWSFKPGRGKGSNSKVAALRWWTRRMKEHVDPMKLIDALKWYQVCCDQDGILNTRTTMQASTFIGKDQHYETNWEDKANAASEGEATIDDYGREFMRKHASAG